MEEILNKWKLFLEKLSGCLSSVAFDLISKNLTPINFEDGIVIIATSSQVVKNQLSGRVFAKTFTDCFEKVYGKLTKFEILNAGDEKEYLKTHDKLHPQQQEEKKQAQFNPKYTFETFVMGPSNKVVYAAAKEVVERPGVKFNPLFIYGGVGLGKTHILNAIGNHFEKHRPDFKIKYITTENFINDYVTALQSKVYDTQITFREQYRGLDVLLVDDIQFLAGKQAMQQEFFNTFNDLYQAGKQIVVTSDRPPRDLTELTDRITSRLSSGLIQDIQSPEFETRLAIVHKKCEDEGYNIDNEAQNLIAEKITTNIKGMEGIRAIEGFLKKIDLLAKMNGRFEATITDAIEVLSEFAIADSNTFGPESVINMVSSFFNLEVGDIIGPRRNKELILPRYLAMLLIREFFDTLPLSKIGDYFNRDHATVIIADKKIKLEVKKDLKLKKNLNDLREMISKKIG